jgi:hypothetical protein
VNNKELLKKWQKKLRLTDWTIKLNDKATYADFTLTDCVGEVSYVEATKTAVIRVLRPDLYGNQIVPFNLEKTLVHELLHLKFSLLDESGNDLQNRIVHQLVEEFANILTEVK